VTWRARPEMGDRYHRAEAAVSAAVGGIEWSEVSSRTKWSIRVLLWTRDGAWCAYCGATLALPGINEGWERDRPAFGGGWVLKAGYSAAHIDHVFPKSQGGTNELSNLVLACEDCNMAKGARTPEQANVSTQDGVVSFAFPAGERAVFTLAEPLEGAARNLAERRPA
jgi:hypothetical protein